MPKQDKAIELFHAVEKDFRSKFMRYHPEWNRLAPQPVPAWFRLRLRAIDKRLVCQYIPPDDIDSRGVPHLHFPWGVWQICRRVRNNGSWLSKRAVYILDDGLGFPLEPSMEILKMIQEARNLRRRDELHLLEDEFQSYTDLLSQTAEDTSKAKILARAIKVMARMNKSDFSSPRIFTGDGIKNRGAK